MFLSTVSRMTLAAFSSYFSFHSASHSASLFVSFFCGGQEVSDRGQSEHQQTYVSPWLQVLRIDGIFVETRPFLKRLLGTYLVFFVVPVQHLGLVFDIYTLAELLEDRFGVVKEI